MRRLFGKLKVLILNWERVLRTALIWSSASVIFTGIIYNLTNQKRTSTALIDLEIVLIIVIIHSGCLHVPMTLNRLISHFAMKRKNETIEKRRALRNILIVFYIRAKLPRGASLSIMEPLWGNSALRIYFRIFLKNLCIHIKGFSLIWREEKSLKSA